MNNPLALDIRKDESGNFVILDGNHKVGECLSWKDTLVIAQGQKPKYNLVRLSILPGISATITMLTLLKSKRPLL